MNEKDTALLSDDYGRDLVSVQALQRKHEGLERDLAALEDTVTIASRLHQQVVISPRTAAQVQAMRRDASQVAGAQPGAARAVRDKEREIVDAWTSLKSRVRE